MKTGRHPMMDDGPFYQKGASELATQSQTLDERTVTVDVNIG